MWISLKIEGSWNWRYDVDLGYVCSKEMNKMLKKIIFLCFVVLWKMKNVKKNQI